MQKTSLLWDGSADFQILEDTLAHQANLIVLQGERHKSSSSSLSEQAALRSAIRELDEVIEHIIDMISKPVQRQKRTECAPT